MKITSAEFIKSVASLDQLPNDGLPEVAFAGRSNVGKSSLLNTLLNRKKIALVSSTPGKTKHLNFFKINQSFYFVDLPGYGFARVSKKNYNQWQNLLESYLRSSPRLRLLVVIIDLRRELTTLDVELLTWLAFNKIPFVLVGTKSDKLSGNKLKQQLATNKKLAGRFGVSAIFRFSSMTGDGKVELWKEILKSID
jgi:GTP-binding protein